MADSALPMTSQNPRDRPLPFPPDPPGQHAPHPGSANHLTSALYSEKLKTNVTWDNRLRRNVLEITLEKQEEAFVDLSQEDIHRLFKTLGINIEKEVEGFFQRNKSIQVWFDNSVNLDRFCRNESIRVTKNIKTGFIRPAGKKEVTVTISGLEFNTPDTFVMSYLSKFGKVVTTSVIYDRYKEGLFKGKYNGDRKYQVDFTKSNQSMGTYHVVDGTRVRVHYPGNKKTCGRCHQTAENCKGNAVAKDCEENGGARVNILDHMRIVWESVGFRPTEFNLETKDDINDADIRDKEKFTPKVARPEPTEKDMERYDGVSIKNFPRTTTKAEIVSFLKTKGLQVDSSENNVQVGDHGNVEINRISSQTCLEIIKNINFSDTREKFFGRPIYCRATRELSPLKSNLETAPNASQEIFDEDKSDNETEASEATLDQENKDNREDHKTEVESAGGEGHGDFLEESGFVFEEADKTKSKLFRHPDETSEADSEEDISKTEKKDHKKNKSSPADYKLKRKDRSSPKGTEEKKEKRSKNK